MRQTAATGPNTEIVSIIRALDYLANEARTSGMPDVAEYIITALHNSGDWALQEMSKDLKKANRHDRLAVIELITRFMSSSEAARQVFLQRMEDEAKAEVRDRIVAC